MQPLTQSTTQPQQTIPSIHAVSITPLQGSGFKQRDRSSERERTHEENLTARRTHSAGIRDKASRDHSPHLPGLHVSMSVAYGGCTRRCLLLGDRVVFGDSPSAPGVPLVYRLPEDRQANPDRLNLDRLGDAQTAQLFNKKLRI
jgi:hypothetical protein